MRGSILTALFGILASLSIAAAEVEKASPADASLAARVAMAYVGGRAAEVVSPGAPGIAWHFRVLRADGSVTDVLLDERLELIDVGDSPSFAQGFRARTPAPASPRPRVTRSTPPTFQLASVKKTPAGLTDRERAARAALEAVGSGRARDVDKDHENGATWEVEVVAADGRALDVLLDARFHVLEIKPERDARESSRVAEASRR